MKKITLTTYKNAFNTSIRDVLRVFAGDPRVEELLQNEDDIDLRSVEDISGTLRRVSWSDIVYETPTKLLVVEMRLTNTEERVTLGTRVDAYYRISYNMYLGYRDRVESIEYSTASVAVDTGDNLKSRLERMGIPVQVLGIFKGESAPKDLVTQGIIAKGATSYRKQRL